MKKLLLLIVPTLMLLGCQTTPVQPERPVIVKTERIVFHIPSQLLEIPDPIPPLTLEQIKNDDRAVGIWLLDSETRSVQLESKLREIRALYIRALRDAKREKAEAAK